MTNSQILIVAAMVVGPEYHAITSVALGLDRRSRPRVREGTRALTAGFPLAIVVTFGSRPWCAPSACSPPPSSGGYGPCPI
ncbi:DUF389 domain-containing protein [Streptomyces sp. PanSC9]|uniref:DUF389 domain-containing protein n=1 Tax=Streptomyces sp. PanSC9 TaxID=1520461 RepID=UPI0021A5FD43|nr:DUF389 domain-containing protein [Streptomyces sp. PanSC9]